MGITFSHNENLKNFQAFTLRSKVSHNKKLFWIMIFFIILLIVLVFLIVKTNKDSEGKNNIKDSVKTCLVDSDCVPKCGCHPDSCVSALERGQCERLICTQECSGPLDCGAGRCGCVNGKCAVVGN